MMMRWDYTRNEMGKPLWLVLYIFCLLVCLNERGKPCFSTDVWCDDGENALYLQTPLNCWDLVHKRKKSCSKL